MPLRAYCIKLKKDFNVIDGLPENPKEYDWKCVGCEEKMIHVNKSYDESRMEHFRHYVESKCKLGEPETKEHLAMKAFVYNNLFHEATFKKLEKKVGNQWADVYYEFDREFREPKKLAVECQHSPISQNELIRRTEEYTKKNIYVIWILDDTSSVVSKKHNSLEELRKSFKKHKIKKINVAEQTLNQINSGTICYINLNTNRFYGLILKEHTKGKSWKEYVIQIDPPLKFVESKYKLIKINVDFLLINKLRVELNDIKCKSHAELIDIKNKLRLMKNRAIEAEYEAITFKEKLINFKIEVNKTLTNEEFSYIKRNWLSVPFHMR